MLFILKYLRLGKEKNTKQLVKEFQKEFLKNKIIDFHYVLI
jgi:hypothetical protein